MTDEDATRNAPQDSTADDRTADAGPSDHATDGGQAASADSGQTASADADQDADPAPDESLSWDEAASGFEQRLQERRTIGVEIPGLGVAEFTLRGLSRDERDEVEQAAASVNRSGRRDADVQVDTTAIRETMLQYGIVSGPDGFKPKRSDHLDRIPPGVQDEMVEIIEELSSLSVEEYDGFQEMG